MRQIIHSLLRMVLVVATATAATACAIDDPGDPTARAGDGTTDQGEAAARNPEVDPPAPWEPLDDATLAAMGAFRVSPEATSARGAHLVTPSALPTGIRLPTGGACPLNYACLYQNANRRGVGIGALIGFGFSNLHSVSCPTCTNGVHGNDGTFNDQMTSWENQSGTRYCWGVNASTHPTDHTMGDGDVTNVPANENDTASSFFPC